MRLIAVARRSYGRQLVLVVLMFFMTRAVQVSAQVVGGTHVPYELISTIDTTADKLCPR